MLNIEDISFTEEMIKGDGDFILVSVKPHYDSRLGEEDLARKGTEIVVALTAYQLEKIAVIVSDEVTCSAFDTSGLKRVRFSDFKGHFELKRPGEHYFVSQASRFQLL